MMQPPRCQHHAAVWSSHGVYVLINTQAPPSAQALHAQCAAQAVPACTVQAKTPWHGTFVGRVSAVQALPLTSEASSAVTALDVLAELPALCMQVGSSVMQPLNCNSSSDLDLRAGWMLWVCAAAGYQLVSTCSSCYCGMPAYPASNAACNKSNGCCCVEHAHCYAAVPSLCQHLQTVEHAMHMMGNHACRV